MNRSMLAALLILASCGDDSAPDLPTGTFRLTGETVNGTVTPASQLNGALELTATEVALAVAAPQPAGILGGYTLSSDGKSLLVGGASLGVVVEGSGLSLTTAAGRRWSFVPVTPSPSDTLQVAGTVTVAAGAPAMSKPRAALVFYSRSEPFVNDPRDDQALTFSGGAAAFDVSRMREALGTDRLTYGTAGISIAVVVIYDDRNDSEDLDELATCTMATVDCVLAVSPVAIAFRDGDSPQLAASQYAFLRSGWSHAVSVADGRNAQKLGLVSADPTIPYAHTISVGDPSLVTVPAFDIAAP